MPDPLPLSALQHLVFCERQCALIHIEGLWVENRLTVEGHILHRRAHAEDAGPRGGGRVESRPDVRIVRGLALHSERLGLVGKADVVEFREPAGHTGSSPVPFPIEYKRGRPKSHAADNVQLCAQALCLEEMLGLPDGGVPAGALYYGRVRRRLGIELDGELRRLTESTAARLHQLVTSGITPRARREPKCKRCSLINLCLPEATAPGRNVMDYINRTLAHTSNQTL